MDVERLAGVLLPASAASIERTAYVELVRVPPGPAPGVHVDELRPERAGSLAPRLFAEMQSAVARAMVGARRVAVMAGGGVDSSVLLALALEVARARGDVDVFPVSLDFEGPGDDRPHLAALAAHLGVAPVRVAPSAAAAFVGGDAWVADASPVTWPSAPLERALAEAAKMHGADRILSGAGGDDLFDGDPTELAALLWRHPLRALERARTLTVPWEASAFERSRDFLMRPALSPLIPAWLRRMHRMRREARALPWAGPVLRAAIEVRAAAGASTTKTPRGAQARYRSLSESPQLHEVATMRVQFEAACGLDRMDPFLDPELLAVVASVPPLMLLEGNRMRGLFRASARSLLPASVCERADKAAFEPAQAEMVRAAGGFDALKPLAKVSRAADLGLVEPAIFASAFEALARDPLAGDWLGVWPLLAVEAFLRSREGVD